MFDQGRGFDWGEGRECVIPLMAFFKHTCYRHIHHILTLHTSGDTWPAAFYLSLNRLVYLTNTKQYPTMLPCGAARGL